MKKTIVILLVFLLLLSGLTACGSNQQDPLENEETQNPEQAETMTDTGRYLGQVDNNFIEIKISGVPDEMDPLVFMLSENIKEQFETLDIIPEDNIKIEYYMDENNQYVITNIEKV
ncbi:MAG: hypothetical protein GX363_08560 [Clostridiales bacterium]|jgi:predicted small lipoprotein YifL|nr:hypothetical protein [Clostridiales bacterium]